VNYELKKKQKTKTKKSFRNKKQAKTPNHSLFKFIIIMYKFIDIFKYRI
jgi:hypothetical protein